jgi:hypothetical protein
VQHCPRDPLHPLAAVTLAHILLQNEHSSDTSWGAHLASLDVMLLVRDHLRILASLAIQQEGPSGPPPALPPHLPSAAAAEHHPAAMHTRAIATQPDDSSSRSGCAATAVVTQAAMCESLEGVLLLLSAWMEDFDRDSRTSSVQWSVRALMQLVATPDIVSNLLRLTLSPAMCAAAGDGSHPLFERALSCVGLLQHALHLFHAGASMQGAADAEGRLLWELIIRMEGFFALEQNAPYLEPLVLIPTPANGEYAVHTSTHCLLSKDTLHARSHHMKHSPYLPASSTCARHTHPAFTLDSMLPISRPASATQLLH